MNESAHCVTTKEVERLPLGALLRKGKKTSLLWSLKKQRFG
jgi:hypothetical protein